MKLSASFAATALTVVVAVAPLPAAAARATVVNVDNFNKAQTDFEFAGIVKLAGGTNKIHSNRAPTPIDAQISKPLACIMPPTRSFS